MPNISLAEIIGLLASAYERFPNHATIIYHLHKALWRRIASTGRILFALVVPAHAAAVAARVWNLRAVLGWVPAIIGIHLPLGRWWIWGWTNTWSWFHSGRLTWLAGQPTTPCL